MSWVSLKSRLVVAKKFVCVVERVEGSNPWKWRVSRIQGDGWPLFGGFCKTEAAARAQCIKHAKKEGKLDAGKVRVLDKLERDWLELFAPAGLV